MDENLTTFLRQQMPLAETLGMMADEAGPESVVLRLAWAEGLCTSGGMIHGGVIMALADTAGATLAFSNLPEGAVGTTTIESKTNFLRGVAEGDLVATARPLHAGSTTIVVETEVTSGERLVAKVTQTQAVLRPR